MNRYYWPLTPDRDQAVRERAVARVVARSRASFEYYLENFPGVKNLKPRPRLAFYRAQGPEYWFEMWFTFPQLAKEALRDYARLVLQYGREVEYAV